MQLIHELAAALNELEKGITAEESIGALKSEIARLQTIVLDVEKRRKEAQSEKCLLLNYVHKVRSDDNSILLQQAPAVSGQVNNGGTVKVYTPIPSVIRTLQLANSLSCQA
jgi:uncharacterized protein YydD (DUF2326 family)